MHNVSVSHGLNSRQYAEGSRQNGNKTNRCLLSAYCLLLTAYCLLLSASKAETPSLLSV